MALVSKFFESILLIILKNIIFKKLFRKKIDSLLRLKETHNVKEIIC